MRSPTLIACGLLLIACSDDSGGTTGTLDTAVDTSADTSTDGAGDSAADTTVDTTADTAADTTADSDEDTAVDTTADSAADTTADSAADTTADSAADADDTADTSGCEYFDEPRIMQCGQAFKQVSYWVDFAHPDTCPPYYTRDGDRYDTFEALATAGSCDAGCEYIARQAVDFIRCDGAGRSGFESFSADGEGCVEQVYRTPDGIFSDLCFWALYNCYCGE